MRGQYLIMAEISIKRNAVNNAWTLPKRCGCSHDPTTWFLREKYTFTSQFDGYSTDLDPQDHRGSWKRTKVKQRRPRVQEEGNWKNVSWANQHVLATYWDLTRKNQDWNIGHGSSPSEINRSWSKESKRLWFWMAETDSSLLAKWTRYLCC